jgi:ketosteroid isomerase-like protein
MNKTCSLIIFVIFCSCQNKNSPSGNTGFDLEAVKSIIEGKNLLYRTAYLSGDSAGFADLHHSQTINMPPNGPLLTGKGAIGATVINVPRQGINDMIITTTDVHGGPLEVIEEGKFGIKTEKNLYEGKYIVIWKQENEIWKIYRCIWNMDSK